MSKAAGKAAGAVGSISGALGGMDGAAGKAVGSISKLMGALATGGPLGLAVAGVTALIGAFQSWREEQEKARQEQERMRFESAKQHLDSYQESVNALAASLDKAAKFQAQFNNTLAAVETNKATVAATQALIAGEKGGTNVSRAEGMRNAVAITQAQNVRNAEVAIQTARTNWRNANKAADAQKNAISGLERYRDQLQEAHRVKVHEYFASGGDEEHATAVNNAAVLLAKAEKDIAAAKDKERELTNAAIQAYNEFVRTTEALNATKAKAELENIRAENALTEAKKKEEEERVKAEQKKREEEEKAWEEEEKARQEALKETWEQVAREKERNDRFREEVRLEQKLRDAIAEEPKLQEELDKATEELKNAEYDLAAKMRKATAASIAADVIAAGGVYNPNNAPVGGRANRRRGAAANNVDNQPWLDFAKPEGWDQRWARSHQAQAAAAGIQAGLSKREQRELDRLDEKFAGGQALSDSEKRRRAELAAKDPERIRQRAEKAAEKAAQEKEAKQAAKDAAEKALQDNVKNIYELMKQLGLK